MFVTACAAGIAAALVFVPLKDFGRRFFVLMSLIAVVFIGLATVDRGLEVSYWHIACAALLVVYNVILPKQPGVDPTTRGVDDGLSESSAGWKVAKVSATLCLIGAVVCGFVGVSVDAMALRTDPLADDVSSAGAISAFGAISGAVTSALLLGAALVSMVLGHWYLVSRKISFGPLRHLTRLLAIALVVRIVIIGVGAGGQSEFWEPYVTRFDSMRFLASDGVFLLSRVLFGILVPAILVPLVWRCVKIESNQSATGILYVIVAFVILGEILSKHFLVNINLLI